VKQDYSATGMFIPIHEEILHHAGQYAHAPAIVHGSERIDFAGLERWTMALAAQLVKAGAGRGKIVGLYLQPSIRMAVSALAVLSTGAAYIPLSAAFPAERIRYILQDAGASLLIAEPGAEASMCPPCTALFHPDWTEAARLSAKAPPAVRPIEPGDLAISCIPPGRPATPKE